MLATLHKLITPLSYLVRQSSTLNTPSTKCTVCSNDLGIEYTILTVVTLKLSHLLCRFQVFIVLNVLVTDEVVQFLTTNKLCDLLVTRGLADDES